jgi:putative ABC transport system permease protein
MTDERLGSAWFAGLVQDVRDAIRQLARNPGFTAVAAVTLALGISANTLVFSVGKAVLLRPLGFEAPEQLVWVRLSNERTGATEDRLSWPDIEDIRQSAQGLESLAAFGSQTATWEQRDGLEEHPALGVTPNLADVLRIQPALGRLFERSDVEQSAAPVVLISHELWQARFGGAPGVIGRTLRLNDSTHTVIGVLPPGLQFPLERAPSAGTGSIPTAGLQSFWFPLSASGEDRRARGARMFLAIGRLRQHVTPETAGAELAALAARLAVGHPETNRFRGLELASFRDQVLGRTRQGVPMLGFAVAAVLLVCCVNLANLLLARGLARRRELAVRLALGAGRWRLIRASMAESGLLALLGGGLGILVSAAALHGVRVLGSAQVPFIREARLDGAACLFAVALSLLTSIAFGLLPALRQSRADVTASLHTGVRSTGDRQLRLWQQGLLVGQIAVALVLLGSAALLLESFRRLVGQDLGYRPSAVVTVDLSTQGFETNGEVTRLYRSLHARLSALPGVQAVGTISSAPLTGKWTFDEKAQAVDRPTPAADRPSLAGTFVAFDYFRAMGIPLRDGRFFDPAELQDDEVGRIAIINETAAALLFPGRSAVGRRFTIGDNNRLLEVVGVVQDTRDVRLEEAPSPRFYLHYTFGGAQVVVRSAVAPATLLSVLRETVQATDRRIIVRQLAPMAEVVSGTVAERRFLMVMIAVYAAVALGVAAVGAFGVMAFQVAQRTHEFGVRLALGSTPRGLLRLVLMQAGRLALCGLVIGLALSLATNRLLASQLFGVSPHDPLLLTTVGVVLLSIALLASLLPARRAARVDPLASLRCQ